MEVRGRIGTTLAVLPEELLENPLSVKQLKAQPLLVFALQINRLLIVSQ